MISEFIGCEKMQKVWYTKSMRSHELYGCEMGAWKGKLQLVFPLWTRILDRK